VVRAAVSETKQSNRWGDGHTQRLSCAIEGDGRRMRRKGRLSASRNELLVGPGNSVRSADRRERNTPYRDGNCRVRSKEQIFAPLDVDTMPPHTANASGLRAARQDLQARPQTCDTIQPPADANFLVACVSIFAATARPAAVTQLRA
jgi:hypothetical protein